MTGDLLERNVELDGCIENAGTVKMQLKPVFVSENCSLL